MSGTRFLIVVGALTLVCAASASAVAATAPPPKDQLRSFVCQKALDPPARAVSVQAVMRPVTGTGAMQMRFDLMRQTVPGGPFRLVRGKLLGSWISPQDPTLGQRPGDVWIVNHPVVDLGAPATYRFRVSFRWTDSHGQQLSSAVQTSPNCWQPELRADLLVKSITVTPLSSGQDTYVATLANRGQTAVGPVEVDLAGTGTGTGPGAPIAATVPSVAARSTAHHRFVAPACTAGSSLTVTVDPSHTIDEYNFANNALTIPCPTPSSSS
jgi:CARDB protein